MAPEIVTHARKPSTNEGTRKLHHVLLTSEQLRDLRDALAAAIMGKHELDLLATNVAQAADRGLPASIVAGAFKPRPVDLDTYIAAELIMVLDQQQRESIEDEQAGDRP